MHPLILASLASQYWAIDPVYLALMALVLARVESGEPAPAVVQDRVETDKQARNDRKAQAATVPGSLAVIPVYGILTQRGNMMDDLSGPGSASTQQLSQEFKSAVADPNVSKILLDIDSPGGSVFGIDELAAEIYAAKGQKPVIAIANSTTASAALWVGAQADELYITPGGEIGSIGVYTAHRYIGEAMKKAGVDITFIQAGEFKTEGNPFEPLGDAAEAHIQTQIDGYYSKFVQAVARGRNVTSANVKTDFGKGRMMSAAQALDVGLVDGILSYNTLLEKLTATAPQPPRHRLAHAERLMRLS
jgi:signal peptide peptidase SppA